MRMWIAGLLAGVALAPAAWAQDTPPPERQHAERAHGERGGGPRPEGQPRAAQPAPAAAQRPTGQPGPQAFQRRPDQPRPAVAGQADGRFNGQGRGDWRGRGPGQPPQPPVAAARDQAAFGNRDGRGFDRSTQGDARAQALGGRPDPARGYDDRRRFDDTRRFDDARGFGGARPVDNRQGYAGRPGYNGRPGGDWNRDWHRDNRYDWNRYRASNRAAFRLPSYYAPRGWGYGYRRFSIGVTLFAPLWAEDYWIDDPYDYRLPQAYGPYHWVRYYNDALLVDVRTGFVVDAVYDIFW